MQSLVQVIRTDQDFQRILTGCQEGLKEQLITGLTGSAQHLCLAALRGSLARPLLIVTHNMGRAQQIYEDLIELLPADTVRLFPEREMGFADVMAYSPELASNRLSVLEALVRGELPLVIAPIAALHQPLTAPSHFASASRVLRVGDEVSLDELLEHLVYLGYERAEMVESKGEFSVRGGILDLFPLTRDEAVRIEFFDVEIDSIRSFDATTQRSLEKISDVVLYPIREFIAEPVRIRAAAGALALRLNEQIAKINDEEIVSKLRENIGADIETMQEGIPTPNLVRYIELLEPSKPTVMDYLSPHALWVFDEPSRLRETIKVVEREEQEWFLSALEHGEMLPGLVSENNRNLLFTDKTKQKLLFSLFTRALPGVSPQAVINTNTRSMQNFHGQMNVLKTELDRWTKMGFQVVFLAANQERAERLQRVLEDYLMQADIVKNWDGTRTRPIIVLGNLATGFELSTMKIAVITETEIFTTKKKTRKMKTLSDAQKIKSYQDLKVGDYVVHINHGIGKYMGIETKDILGIHKDYMHIKYKGKDELFVPVEQIDLVQKYVGSEEKEPKIYALGGSDWQRVRTKVQSAVQDIAEDLIKLYAEREATRGHAFSQDTAWQREFEAMFPYNETEDQIRCIEEIKKDMQRIRPMDRLLCGDVGYGKTEVAIRAAFKSVMDGKQVAVLVPTTILAQQHFQTFSERMAGFPVNVQLVSRFRSKAQITEVQKGMKEGAVDIVIGTHRLLSKTMQFKELGLLIIDEEQRFGVTHKEKLKQLKTNVDCLTLTATPIPRTLHMSMIGVRDLSVIETPPENRFPVQTYVVEHNDGIVRESIEREMGRGGQVYYLFNKINGIQETANHIKQLVPEAKVLVGHGQMPEDELERTMLDFLSGEADVLVSTTIIETGLDVPNVNTLIVQDADHLGLSQLYQLRGRVGRSNRIAYSYFTYQRNKVLNETAEKRLQAIKEFTELGSGFKIAMRDLSIRGAGNLLGAQQHGFIASVGFDLYSQMLAEAIEELKQGGVKEEKVPDPVVELSVDAYLPTTYIEDSMQKIEIYKKFVSARALEDVRDLEEEVEDRFGDIPLEVRNLLAVSRLKAYALKYRFNEIKQTPQGEILLKLDESQNKQIDGEKLFAMTREFPNRMKLTAQQQIIVTLKAKGLKDEEILSMLEKFMELYKVVPKRQEDLENVSP
ncbi:transcription-repair coupling factor [Tumebacillus permanentifrigoris]|uniref:Transcription-repair-coupling factor n=1 Tax=Tumebacillus permanentifrigoris TaxID=378543 RepID=A0A316D717_9BACL|nr:transcription-repair coupling factor [Tumebacillus permanentifrigoris]PWK07897.1 transcription-repair coupling factor [Tumebacillus permanentifrigoris]